MLTKEQLKQSIDKYGDSSKLVNRLGIAEEETEVVVLALWWHPNKLYNNYDCKIEFLSDEFPDVHRITYNNKSFLHIRSYVGATNVGKQYFFYHLLIVKELYCWFSWINFK